MTVIVKKKDTFDTVQLENVTNIAYNAGTKVYTITYGSSQTATYNAADYVIGVLFS